MKGHIWQTLDYFTTRGAACGLGLGIYAGTAFIPVVGTLFGGMFGLVMGLGAGVICGLLTQQIHRQTFHEDTNLEEYSRYLSRIIGVVGGVSALVMLWLIVAVMISIIDSDPATNLEVDLILFASLVITIPALFLADLSLAYIASYYPAWIVRHLKLDSQIDVIKEEVPKRGKVYRDFDSLVWHPVSKWMAIVGGIGGWITLLVAALQQWPITLDELPAIIFAGPAAAGLAGVAWVYCAFGNAMVLTFLKRVIYQEHLSHLTAHWYRISLTLISFVLTWAMIWWTTIPGPIIAILMARAVYHTLALPDETLDKAKRKEKNALALEDDIDEEESLLVDETEQIELQNR